MTISDEMLRAYVDGELSADEMAAIEARLESDELAQERVTLMCASGDYLKEARDEIVQGAPQHDQLRDAILAGTLGTSDVQERKVGFGRGYAIAASIAAAFFLIGGLLGSYLQPFKDHPELPGWAERVADYQTLYSRRTVENSRMSKAAQVEFVKEASKTVGQELVIPDLSRHGLEFRRAQFLSFEGRPVIQLVYLPQGAGEPVAICLTRSLGAASAIESHRHRNLNLVSWTNGNVDFLLASHMPDKDLRSIADEARL